MKEFKTLGPTQFGIGDGVKTRFSVARPGDIVRDSNIESVRRVGWQGDQLLHPYPRTNLAIASNDFTNSAWQGSPSLYVDFLSGKMPSSVDFSRASTATYVGRDRLIHTAAINEPRFTYDPMTGESLGLLVEGQATNLISWSSDGEEWWAGSDITTINGETPSPIEGTSFTIAEVERDFTGSAVFFNETVGVVSGAHVLSCFVSETHTIPFLMFNLDGAWGSHRVIVDLETYEIRTDSRGDATLCVERFPPGVRLAVTLTVLEAGQVRALLLGKNSTGTAYSDTWTAGQFMEVTGVQLEEGTHPTSYIPTEGSQVTRAADNVSRELGEEFNPCEFTLFVEFDYLHTGSVQSIAALNSDGSHGNRFVIESSPNFRLRDGTGALPTISSSALPSGKNKIAFAYTTGSLVLAANGVITNQAVGDFSELADRLADQASVFLGENSLGHFRQNGQYSRIAYYPRALTNEQLQALTS